MPSVLPVLHELPLRWEAARLAISDVLRAVLDDWLRRPGMDVRAVVWRGGDALDLLLPAPPKAIVVLRAVEEKDRGTSALPPGPLDWTWANSGAYATLQSPSALTSGTSYVVTLLVVT